MIRKLYSVRFYADGLTGKEDEFFAYDVQDGGHAVDLLLRFMGKGFRMKAVFIVNNTVGGRGSRIGATQIEQLASMGREVEAKVRAQVLSNHPPGEANIGG